MANAEEFALIQKEREVLLGCRKEDLVEMLLRERAAATKTRYDYIEFQKQTTNSLQSVLSKVEYHFENKVGK